MNGVAILLIILTAARLWIAVQLFLSARKSKLNNLYWLSGLFALGVANLFLPTSSSPFASYPLFHTGLIASHFCLAMFIHTTFYRDRKSPIYFMLGLLVLAVIGDIYAFIVNDINLQGIIASVGIINWGWHLLVATSAYNKIALDPSVEKWVKSRYKLMIVYIVLMIFVTAQVVASSSNLSPYVPSFMVPVGLLIIISSIILQFLVWVMPERFRLWLNRSKNTQPTPEKEEEQRLSILDVFGVAMTMNTGLNTIACLYAIRSSVAKKIGSQDSSKIQQHINTMTYYEWDTILQQAELERILMNGGADKNIAQKAIGNARQALVEKQSLLTFSSR